MVQEALAYVRGQTVADVVQEVRSKAKSRVPTHIERLRAEAKILREADRNLKSHWSEVRRMLRNAKLLKQRVDGRQMNKKMYDVCNDALESVGVLPHLDMGSLEALGGSGLVRRDDSGDPVGQVIGNLIRKKLLRSVRRRFGDYDEDDSDRPEREGTSADDAADSEEQRSVASNASAFTDVSEPSATSDRGELPEAGEAEAEDCEEGEDPSACGSDTHSAA
eukprot:SRR837773.9017.p1 GENE.SRR837773.9017~~SRR837773.9017.p1  ORF type:complete len:229 (+),score=88.51 SRR837773.9017:27-689(+)